jgi:hypothetical protein
MPPGRVLRLPDKAIQHSVSPLDAKPTLAQDIETLRRLIDDLLDENLPPDDVALLAATKLLNEKLECLRAST